MLRAEHLDVFCYGSLMRAPELPDAIVGGFLARLDGFVRSFNKRSAPRGAWAHEGFGDHPAASRALRRADGFCESLALGTERRGGGAIVGWVHRYPASVRAELLALLDAREGVVADADPRDNGYRRELVTVVADEGDRVDAVAYLSNDVPGNRLLLDPATTADARARILIAATPREAGARPRGLDYAADTASALAARGVRDAAVDAVLAAARACEGPWRARLPPIG